MVMSLSIFVVRRLHNGYYVDKAWEKVEPLRQLFVRRDSTYLTRLG